VRYTELRQIARELLEELRMAQAGKIKGDLFASMEDDLKQFWAALSGVLGAAAGAIAQRGGIVGAVEDAVPLLPDAAADTQRTCVRWRPPSFMSLTRRTYFRKIRSRSFTLQRFWHVDSTAPIEPLLN
jgi:hypothetical protein